MSQTVHCSSRSVGSSARSRVNNNNNNNNTKLKNSFIHSFIHSFIQKSNGTIGARLANGLLSLFFAPIRLPNQNARHARLSSTRVGLPVSLLLVQVSLALHAQRLDKRIQVNTTFS